MKYNSGASLLYVLAALIVTSFISVALIKAASCDQQNGVLYHSSASARSAAKSGIIAAISYLQAPQNIDEIEELINEWRIHGANVNNKYKKIPINGNIDNEGFVLPHLSINQKYKVKIIAFDIKKMNIALKCDAIGKGNSRASIMSVYHLDGLNIKNGPLPSEALHIGGGGNEFNRAIRVHGNTFIKGGGKFYDPLLQKSVFDGRVHVAYAEDKTCLFKGVHFKDTTFFAGDVDFEIAPSIFDHDIFGPICEFDKAVGSEAVLKIRKGAGFPVHSDGFYTRGKLIITDVDKINLCNNAEARGWKGKHHDYNSNNQIATNNSFSLFFENATSDKVSEENQMPVKSILNVPESPKVSLRLDEIRSHAQPLSSLVASQNIQISGTVMNSICKSFSPKLKDRNDREWTVIRYDQPNFFDMEGENFRGNVIWLFNDSVNFDSRFYEHATDAITFIYVGPNGLLKGIGGCKEFRGMIYSETKKQNIYKAIGGSTFRGGIYQEDDGGALRIEGHPVNPGGFFDVYYDPEVIKACSGLGFYDADDPDYEKIIMTSAKISATLISQNM